MAVVPTFEKEGLQAAVDFVKYLLTLAGGGIALLIQPNFYQTSLLIKVLSSFSFICLSVCIISGLLVHARGCVMLAEKKYDLEDWPLKVPGLINQLSFFFGFTLLGIGVALRAWG
jgi:hypothetical protein